jgi:Na+/proline symporter
LPVALLFFAVGTGLYVFYQSHPTRLAPGLGEDAVFSWFIAHELPAGLSGIVLGGLLAAAMSSLDSSLHSAATVIHEDFAAPRPPARSPSRPLHRARWATLLLGTVATGVALWMAHADIRSQLDLFVKLLGLIGGGLSGIFVLGVFTRRTQARSALLGGVAGGLASLVAWLWTPLHFFLWGAVGLGACVVCGYASSWLWPEPARSLAGLCWSIRKRA